ncbi:MAG: DUF5676 family membrane protein [Patescibacteria group bacterium]
MINTNRLLKVSVAWMSIVYVVCYAGVAMFGGIREEFMRWALHTDIGMGANVMTFGTFISGLIIWNVIVIIAVWLFAILWNSIKE